MPRGDRLPLPKDVSNILVEVDEIWRDHNNPHALTSSRAITYNGDFYRLSRGPTICRLRGHIPTYFDVSGMPRSYACIDVVSFPHVLNKYIFYFKLQKRRSRYVNGGFVCTIITMQISLIV